MARKPKRREKGSGSVYPIGKGRYMSAVYDANGKLIRARHPDRATAEAHVKEQNAQKAAGINLRAGIQTLYDFLMTWFNEVAVPRGIRAKTAENYRKRLEYYILPYLGHIRLDRLQPEDIQRWINQLRAEKLAPSTIRDVYNLLKNALDMAVRWRYIQVNPLTLVDRPRVKKEERMPLTPTEVRALLDTTADHRLAALFQLALTLGLRLGELLGLRWADLNWDAATLAVTQQVQHVEDKVVISPPKTDSSKRLLPVPPMLLSALRAHWQRQREERLYLGMKWKEHGLIFPSEVGTPMAPRNFEAAYYRLRTKAGIPDDRNFHLLRHTVATRLADADVNERVIAAILGHSPRTITGRYTHATLDTMRRAVVQVEEQLRRAA